MNRESNLVDFCTARIAFLTNQGYNIDLTGVPPHLINEILKNIQEPAILNRIQKNNSDNPCVEEIAERYWERFVLKKFFYGSSSKPVLEPGQTFRKYFIMRKKQLKEEQEKMMQTQAQKPKEKQKSKILSMNAKTITKDSKIQPKGQSSNPLIRQLCKRVSYRSNMTRH